MNFDISTISSDLQSKMCQDSKKWGHMTGAFLRIIFNLKTLKHNMESRLVKSIFLKNPPVHDNIFFESWFNFDCESDGIIGIPKLTFLESIGTKFESNHLVWGWHTSLWCMPLTMNQIRKCDVSSSFLIDYQRKSENHKIRKKW